LGVVKAMQLYLEAHPAVTVAGVATAELAGGVYDELSTAFSASKQAKADLRKRKAARNAAANAVRVDLMLLRRELSMVLEDNDPRWLDFGFNVPADVSVPDAPEVFSVTAGAPGHLVLNWAFPTNATRVRVFRQIVGVDAEFVHIDTLKESSKDIGGFTSGAHVKFYITAANAAGEGLPSRTVEVVAP